MSFALVIGCVTPSLASAQRIAGPYEGLFAGEYVMPDLQPVTTRVDLRGAFSGAYEDVAVPEGDEPVDPRLQTTGASLGVNGSLFYDRRTEHTRFRAGGASAIRRYSNSGRSSAAAVDASSFLTTDLGPRSTFEGRASVAYSRLYQFAPFAAAAVPDIAPISTGFDHAAVWQPNVVMDGTAVVTHNFSRRSSLSGDVTWHKWRFLESSGNDLLSRGAHGSFRHRLTRTLGLRLGYGRDYNDSAVVAFAAPLYETYDVGLDFGDTLTIARRTAVSFTTATGAMRYLGEMHYRLNGSAAIVRGFGRTWSASAGYRRTTEVQPGFREPLISDSVGGSAGGLLGRRLNLTVGGGYSRGSVGFSGVKPFSSYSATANAVVGLTRSLGVYGQYTYYRYAVPNNATTLNFLSRFARQAVSAGLTVWTPIFNETRPPRDTR